MQGDFGEILMLLFEATVWVLKATSYMIAFAFLVLSFLVPWRLPCTILTILNASDSDTDFRIFCAAMFGVSVADAIAVPLGVVSAMMPSCTASVIRGTCLQTWQTVTWSDFSHRAGERAIELRFFWVSMFFVAAFDCLVMPLALLGCLVPTRLPFGCSKMPRLCLCKDMDRNSMDGIASNICEVRWMLLVNAGLAAVDAVAIFSAGLLCLLPLRLYVAAADAYSSLSRPTEDEHQANIRPLLGQPREGRAPGPRRNKGFVALEKDFGINLELRFDVIYHAACLLIDIFFLPFGFLSALMPTRTWYFLDLLAQLYCNRSCVDRKLEFNREKREHTDCQARASLAMNLVFAVVDLLSAFCGFIAIASVFRACQTWKDVREALKRERKHQGNFLDTYNADLRFTLITNGLIAGLDVFFAPFLIALGLTMWRAKPVVDSIRKGFDWTTRKLILVQSMSLAADILTLPFLLIVLATWYRSAAVRSLMFEPDVEGEDDPQGGDDPAPARRTGRGYHATLMRSALLLLCDVLISPLLLILIVTVYRARYIRDATEYEECGFHSQILRQVGRLICDLPYFFMALVLFFTLVRSCAMCSLAVDREKTGEQRRKVVCSEFTGLLKDASTLFPLALVILTLYRLPLVIGQWKVLWSSPLAGAPLLEVRGVSIKSPKPSGSIALRFQAAKPPTLHGLKYIRFRILGNQFWNLASEKLGTAAQLAQCVFPLTMTAKTTQLSNFEEGADTVTFEMRFTPKVGFIRVSETSALLRGGEPLCLQLEAVCDDGQAVLLVAIGVPMHALGTWVERAAQTDDQEGETPFVPMPEESFITDDERVSELRGEHKRLRDTWHGPVLVQCGSLLNDVVMLLCNCWHLLLWCFLLFSPHRFWKACTWSTEPHATRLARYAKKAAAGFDAWEEECVELSAEIDEVAIKYVKIKAARAETRRQSVDACYDCICESDSPADTATLCCECITECCCCCPCCFCIPSYFDLREAFFDDEDLDDPTTQAGHRMRQRNKNTSDLGMFRARARLDEMSAFLESVAAGMGPIARDAAWAGEGDLHERVSAASRGLREGARLWHDVLWWQLAVPCLQEDYVQRGAGRWGHDSARDEDGSAALKSLIASADWCRGQAGAVIERMEACRSDVHATLSALQKEARHMGKQRSRRLRADWKGVIRRQARGVLGDLIALPLLLLLLLTVYKIPDLSRDLGKARSMRERRLELMRHFRALGWDLLQFLQLVLLSAVLVVTVVKLPDFVLGFNPHKGLRKLNRWAMHNIVELAMGIAELFFMLTFCKAYRMMVSSAMFAAFSPATVLAYAMPRCLPTVPRFITACLFMIAFFGVFLGFPEERLYVACGAAACFVIAFVGLAVNDVPGWMGKRDMDWWSPTARSTPLNNLALLIIAVEAVALGLFAAIASAGDWPAGMKDTWWLEELEDGLEDTYSWLAFGLAAFTVVLNAMPLIAESDVERGEVTTHPQWLCATAVLMELLLLPIVGLLYPVVVPETGDGRWLQSLVMFYYVFVTMLAPASWDAPLESTAHLDIRTVGLYGSAHRLFLLAAAAGAFRQWEYGVTIICAVDFLWALAFITRGCSVLWVQVLRLGIGSGGVAVGLTGSLAAAPAAWFICVVLAVVVAAVGYWNRSQEKPPAADLALLTSLQSLLTRLALWGDRIGGKLTLGADCTAHDAAFLLLEIEARLPVERLQPSFVRERVPWRQGLWRRSFDFDAVMKCAKELDSAFFAPPSTANLRRMLLHGVRQGKGLPQWLSQEVLDFLRAEESPRMQFSSSPDYQGGFLNSRAVRSLWSKVDRGVRHDAEVNRRRMNAKRGRQAAPPQMAWRRQA